MHYLIKSEPDQYSLSDLERDGETLWDGVSNPVALKNLAAMHPGDHLVYYHTGGERLAVGTATVKSVDASDPKAPKVHIKYGKAFAHPRSLTDVKADSLFEESPLVKQGRLSVVPLTAAQYEWFGKGS